MLNEVFCLVFFSFNLEAMLMEINCKLSSTLLIALDWLLEMVGKRLEYLKGP